MEADMPLPVDPTEFFDSNERVLELMNMRRNRKYDHQIADELKARLCNKIRELVQSMPGLRERIVAISEIDPELTAYIVALESLNRSIWAPKSVYDPLAIGHTGNNVQTAQTVQPPTNSLEVAKLTAHLFSAREELTLLARENNAMKNRMDLIMIKLDSYDARLNTIGATAPSVQSTQQSTQSSVQSVQSVHSVQSVQPPTHQLNENALRDAWLSAKVDLPPAPEHDISFTLGDISTADSLLA